MDPLFDLPALLRVIWERVPRRVWLALGLTIVTLVVGLQSRGLGRPGVAFDFNKMGTVLVPPLYFLVAATLWVGVGSWRSGRRSAEWAAGLFLVAGVMDLALRVMQSTGIGMAVAPDAAVNSLMLLRSLASVLALVGAGVLLAHGLWQGRRPITATGRAVLLGLGILGILAGSLIIASAIHVTTFPNVEITPWTSAMVVLHSAWVLSLAAVTGSALVRPWHFRAAQAAVVTGVLGLAFVDTAQNALVWFTLGNSPTSVWTLEAYGVLSSVSVVCLLLLGIGLLASAEGEPEVDKTAMDGLMLPGERQGGETAP